MSARLVVEEIHHWPCCGFLVVDALYRPFTTSLEIRNACVSICHPSRTVFTLNSGRNVKSEKQRSC